MKRTIRYLVHLLFALASLAANASDSKDGDDIRANAVPVTDEPLHIVRYDAPPFLIYTNYIMPGTRWAAPVIEAVTSNRRGSAYRLVLEAGASIELPDQGRGLMLVPLAPLGPVPRLQLDAAAWKPTLGDFRFYSDSNKGQSPRPTRLTNAGEYSIGFTVFVAC